MDINSVIETDGNRDLPPPPDRPKFEQKAYALIDKFGVRNGILNLDQVVARTYEFTRQYNLPESFTDDEANLGLLLGCSQKIIESTDPHYKARVEGLARRLVSRSVQKGILDEEELWGSSSDRGAALDDDQLKEYVVAKTDPEATRQFEEKYREEIDRCKEVWRSKGYDLDVQVHIVDDTAAEFQRQTRSQAYVDPPEREKLDDPNYKPVVELVMLKGHSAERAELVKHELYHIEDFFDNQRRGYQSGIFELLDELHTEQAVGNYTSEHSKEPFNSAYYTAKEFWDKLSFLGDLDFNLIADRPSTLLTIGQRFGFEGLVDFALMYTHGGAKVRTFETFYSNPERAVLAMLIDRDKLTLLKGVNSGTDAVNSGQVKKGIADLADYMTPAPTGEGWNAKFKSLYDLVPSQYGQYWAAHPLEGGYSSQVDNEQMKQIINSFSMGVAVAELASRGVGVIPAEAYAEVRDLLVKVPLRRQDANFAPEGEIEKKREHYSHIYPTEEEFRREQVRSFYHGLVSETQQVELAFNLHNPDVKQAMLGQFFEQLDQLVEYAQGSPENTNAFIMGMFGYNLPFEIREASVAHLSDKYPQLRPLFEKVKQVYDSRKLANQG